ncbi:transposase [uncultured Traorella sp.]|uniref:transposase n=1 Tax=uncultured Traorella sp. TaxID=1929048 RepID=UPI00341B7C81
MPVIYCVITNKENGNPKSVLVFYEERGNIEKFTKKLKDDFNGGKLSHREFLKNEIEFFISSLSSNIFHIFQNTILKNDDRKIRMNTFRSKYQKR